MAYEYRSAEFPLDSSFQLNDGGITVDVMLNEPTRITRYVNEVVNQNLLSPRLFSSTPVSGGVLIYNQILGKIDTATTEHRTNVREPGAEFAEIDQTYVSEKFTRVKQIGAQVSITDEAVKRNDTAFLQKQLQILANRIVTDIDSDAVAAFDKAMAELPTDISNELTVPSQGWAQVTKTKAADKTPAASIEADLESLRLKTKQIDLGYNYSTLLVNPLDEYNLRLALGPANVQTLFGSYGYTVEANELAPQGTAWLLAPQQVGVIGVETPTTTNTYRDEAHLTTHTQTYATMGHAITDPLAMLKLTGVSA